MDNLIWSCHACKKVRADENISVLTYPWRDDQGDIIEGGEVNFRYCNDNSNCRLIAQEHVKKGTLN